MAYKANVYNVMIASPGDVAAERHIIREVLSEWNVVNSETRGMVLLPVGWETHSSPEMGASAQDIINKQILAKCDLLVGVFWTRIGTETEEFASGTVEEIEKYIKAGKPVMLYFSNQPVVPDSVEADQYAKLKEFKQSCKDRGLLESYDDYGDFKNKFSRQLQLKINEHEMFAIDDHETSASQPIRQATSRPLPKISLSREAQVLLKEGSKDNNGTIIYVRHLGGTDLETNGKNFMSGNSPRDVAKWEGALKELVNYNLVVDRGHKGEVFQLTNDGYKIADMIQL